MRSWVRVLLVAGAAWLLLQGLVKHHDRQPFFAALALFVLSYAGLGISFFPRPAGRGGWE